MPMTIDEGLPTAAVAEMTGVSVRALDHWARLGVYQASGCSGSGSGHRRSWTAADVRVVKVLRHLTERNCPLKTMTRAAVVLADARLKEADNRWLLLDEDRVEVVPASRLTKALADTGATWVVNLAGVLAERS